MYYYYLLTICVLVLAQACSQVASSEIIVPEQIPDIKLEHKFLSIEDVEELINSSRDTQIVKVDFSSPIAPLANNPYFDNTQSGAHLSHLSHTRNQKFRLDNAVRKSLSALTSTSTCSNHCSQEFKDQFFSDRQPILARTQEIARQALSNEIRNHEDYLVFYHGFPNDFRLYQDVLKIIKSYELTKQLDDSYLFRDYSFTDNNMILENFLKSWWPAYLEHVKEKNLPPFPTKELIEKKKAPGKNTGLTLYPDSISFAQTYLLSTNVALLGNTLSPMNSTLFFFANSTSATGLDIVDWLIEIALKPYVKNKAGDFDQDRFKQYLAKIKELFDSSMAQAGGQLAQIFIRKDIAAKLSFMAWNGGEPIWTLKKTWEEDNILEAAFAQNKTGYHIWRPINMFWPKDPKTSPYFLPRITKVLEKFINRPTEFQNFFLIKHPGFQKLAQKLLQEDPTDKIDQDTKIFASRDLSQARVLPNPKYFSDSKLVATKLFTFKPISENIKEEYFSELENIIREIFSNFLATADSVDDFKPGDHPLKNAFLKLQSKNN